MGMMMNQELARAILIGDGRLSNSAFKIKETSVRPIAFDSDVWTIPHNMSVTATADDALDELIELRSSYQGSGTPTLYVSGDQVSAWLVAKNSLGETVQEHQRSRFPASLPGRHRSPANRCRQKQHRQRSPRHHGQRGRLCTQPADRQLCA